MNVQLSPDLQSELIRLADEQGRDSHSLVVEAVERMVDYDRWFLAQVDEGLAQVDAGRTLSHEEVGKRLEARFASKRVHG